MIPVSGARDSYFIVHFTKHVLGLHPLLVTYNKQYNTRIGIRNLAYLRSELGCDIMFHTVSPERAKRITRESIRQLGSIYWHCLAGQTVFPVQIAVRFKIPLIIWGAHQGLDQVGMFSHVDEVEMTRKYRKEHDLMGLEAADLARDAEAITVDDVEPFAYPHDKELESVGVRGVYLGNYVRWDSKAQHEAMIEAYGYETRRLQRTFDSYNDVDSFHYSGLHDQIKVAKWGYGKVTDHACREIRLKRLTREAGVDLVEQYTDIEPTDTELFLEWVGLDEEELWRHVDRFRDSEIWTKDEDGRWALRDSILRHRSDEGVDEVRLPLEEQCDFRVTEFREPGVDDDEYILFGRGWVD